MHVEDRRHSCSHILQVLFTLGSEAGSLSFSSWARLVADQLQRPRPCLPSTGAARPWFHLWVLGIGSDYLSSTLFNYFPNPIPFKNFRILNKKQYFFWVYSWISYSQHIINVLDFFLYLKSSKLCYNFILLCEDYACYVVLSYLISFSFLSFCLFETVLYSIAQTNLELVSSPALHSQVCATFPSFLWFLQVTQSCRC